MDTLTVRREVDRQLQAIGAAWRRRALCRGGGKSRKKQPLETRLREPAGDVPAVPARRSSYRAASGALERGSASRAARATFNFPAPRAAIRLRAWQAR